MYSCKYSTIQCFNSLELITGKSVSIFKLNSYKITHIQNKVHKICKRRTPSELNL